MDIIKKYLLAEVKWINCTVLTLIGKKGPTERNFKL